MYVYKPYVVYLFHRGTYLCVCVCAEVRVLILAYLFYIL